MGRAELGAVELTEMMACKQCRGRSPCLGLRVLGYQAPPAPRRAVPRGRSALGDCSSAFLLVHLGSPRVFSRIRSPQMMEPCVSALPVSPWAAVTWLRPWQLTTWWRFLGGWRGPVAVRSGA